MKSRNIYFIQGSLMQRIFSFIHLGKILGGICGTFKKRLNMDLYFPEKKQFKVLPFKP